MVQRTTHRPSCHPSRHQPRPISALRQRMIEDMTIRNLSQTTQRSYVHAVKSFTRHFGRSPDQATSQEDRKSVV